MIPSLPQLIAASLTTLPDQGRDMTRHDLTQEFHLLMQPPPQVDADPPVIVPTDTGEGEAGQPPAVVLRAQPASLPFDPQTASSWPLAGGDTIARDPADGMADIVPLPHGPRLEVSRILHSRPSMADEFPGPDAVTGTEAVTAVQERPRIPTDHLSPRQYRPASMGSMPDMPSHDDMLMPVDTARQDGQNSSPRTSPAVMSKGWHLQNQPLPAAAQGRPPLRYPPRTKAIGQHISRRRSRQSPSHRARSRHRSGQKPAMPSHPPVRQSPCRHRRA